VTAFVDTNVIIRHLTGDPPDLAARATAFLAEADELLLSDLIVAETVYVLESFYEVDRTEVTRLARSVIGFPAMRTLDPALLLRSLEVYENYGIDFAGGTEMLLRFAEGVATDEGAVRSVLSSCAIPEPNVIRYGETQAEFLVRFGALDDPGEVAAAVESAGLDEATADAIVEGYEAAQLQALKTGLLVAAIIALLTLLFTRYLPDRRPGQGPSPPVSEATA